MSDYSSFRKEAKGNVLFFGAKKRTKRRIRGTRTFIHSLYTNIHNIFPQELLSKCSLS